MQRALLQYRKKENYDLVYEALKKAGREDLIGYGSKCLIHPPKNKIHKNSSDRPKQTSDRAKRTGDKPK
jgi:hypothetical protein